MNKLLVDDVPLVLLPKLAAVIGLNEAIFLQQVHYWCQLNQRNNKPTKAGHYWVYQTLEAWRQQLPFWSVMTIRRTVLSLQKQGLLVIETHNKHGRDRTRWYRPNYENITKLQFPCVQNEQMTSVQNEHMQVDKMNTPLPETNTGKQRESAPPSKKRGHQTYQSPRNDDQEFADFMAAVEERMDG